MNLNKTLKLLVWKCAKIVGCEMGATLLRPNFVESYKMLSRHVASVRIEQCMQTNGINDSCCGSNLNIISLNEYVRLGQIRYFIWWISVRYYYSYSLYLKADLNKPPLISDSNKLLGESNDETQSKIRDDRNKPLKVILSFSRPFINESGANSTVCFTASLC